MYLDDVQYTNDMGSKWADTCNLNGNCNAKLNLLEDHIERVVVLQ